MSRSNDNTPVRTVRLGEKEQAKLLAQLARQDVGRGAGVERRRIRVPFEGQTVIVVLKHPNGSSDKYAVVPRNLSAQGMAFIHGQFIHSDRTCRVVLPNLQKRWVAVQGKVNHCRHVDGIIHEVAIRFNETLNLAHFVDLTAEQAERYRSEFARDRGSVRPLDSGGIPAATSGPAPLAGTVLLVDAVDVDRRLFSLWLGGQGLSVTETRGAQDTLAEVKRSRPSLIVLDIHLGDPWNANLARQIRLAGYRGPIAAVSADDTDITQATVMAAGCNAFLGKPCERSSFAQMVEQLLTLDPDLGNGVSAAPIRSSFADDFQMARMLDQFVESLAGTVESVLAAQDQEDLDTLHIHCQQIKGSAGNYGLEPLSQAARLALAQLQQPKPDAAGIKKAIDELVSVARRVGAE